MISLRVTFAALAVTAMASATLLAQGPQTTLSRAVAAYRSASTISARFDQTVTNPLTDRTLSTTGELLRQRPNLLSISFQGVDPDRIVADGVNLWVYLPSTAPGQVMKMSASSGSAMLVDPMGQILSAPADSYDIADAGTATISGHATHAIALTPKSRSAMFTTATIWVDDVNGLVRQLESREQSGLVRKITVTSFRTNLAIPRSTFQFAPPPNVRVIDATSMSPG
ncbi:MAG: outer membrane lipoprotein chaperone LolA [Gemmatimonadota bacterium]|nr:outer membrane lipoprotein chaperone LolA [Gemmatimonadota bacterium]